MKSIAHNHLPLAATIGLLAILAIAAIWFLAIPAVALGQTNDPPVRPTGLTGTVAHDQVALSWDNPGDATITGYQILRRNKDVDDPGVFHVHVDSTGSAATSYVDSDVEVETRYTYRIKAINAHGKSPRSSYFNANTPAAPPPPEPETPDPPTRPTGLTNTVTHDSVFLSWDDPNDDSITGYRILRLNRAEDSPGEFHVHVASTGTAATSYTDSDVEPETRYVYRIHALNTGGKSPRSGYTNADTPAAPAAPIPAAPTNLLTASTHNQVRINWSDPDDDSIIGYRVLRGPDADNLATLVDDTNSASASYTDDSVDAETTYVYALQARNSSGDSDRSETVEVTTQQAPDEPTPERSTHGVCGRTTAVRDAIVAAVSGVTDCGDVTTTHLEDITTLNLFRKNIASLQSGDFDGLTGLTTLDLGRNSLETLPASIFDGLTALTTLSLNRNSLESLRADVFDSLTALTTLNLEDNALETLPADVFESPTALTALDISSNSLTTLPANVFNQLAALTTLDLSRNDLESRLTAGAFNGLTALTSLDLHGNSLDNLPADVFDGLTALTTLALYSNDLETLPADVFDGLTMLTTCLRRPDRSTLEATIWKPCRRASSTA